MNIYDVFTMTDNDIVDFVFEAWLDSDDCGRWELRDVTDTCSEDDASDRATAHFEDWFENFLVNLDDPIEMFADEHGADIFFARIEPLKSEFVDAVFASLESAVDFYCTWQSLPR